MTLRPDRYCRTDVTHRSLTVPSGCTIDRRGGTTSTATGVSDVLRRIDPNRPGPDPGHPTGRPGRRADAGRPRRRRSGASCAPWRRVLRDRGHLHALQRAAGRRNHRGRNGPLPLASRLFQPAHRGSAARAGAEPCFVLGGRCARRKDYCAHPEESRRRRSPASGRSERASTGTNRDRRRRSSRLCSSRDAAARALPGQHSDAQRRRVAPGRPAQSVEGLSGGQRTGRLGAAAPGELLPGSRHRAAAGRQGGGHRLEVAGGCARGRSHAAVRPTAACHRRRAEPAVVSRLGVGPARAGPQSMEARRDNCAGSRPGYLRGHARRIPGTGARCRAPP